MIAFLKIHPSLHRMFLKTVGIALLLMGTVAGHTQKTNNAGKSFCNVSNEELKELNKIIQANMVRLKAAGKLDFSKFKTATEAGAATSLAADAVTPVLFRWPLVTASYRDFASWSITNFVDLDSYTDGDDNQFENNERADYNCGERTYDEHHGIDIGVHPYHWELKESGFVKVIAAADGIIVHKHSGEVDENCDWDNATYTTTRGNNVVILHNDGTTASFYMHMKDGSLTTKREGDPVAAGDYLGTVASSGNSTGPHLHFQVNTGYVDDPDNADDETGRFIDPFANGSAGCATSTASSWIQEMPYNDPAVLTLETHSAQPGHYDGNCDKTVSLYPSNAFTTNQTIYFRSQFRDWIDGTTITHKIYKPDGTLWTSYNRTNASNYRTYFPADQGYLILSWMPSGTYRYTVSFGGKTYSHYFTINCNQNLNLAGAVSGHKGYMASNTINSSQTVSSTATNYLKYMADQKVVLAPGFRAVAGCRFVANLEGCSKSVAASSGMQETPVVTQAIIQQADAAEPAINNDLTVYPNPSSGQFAISYKEAKLFDAVINIRSVDGKLVYSQLKKNTTHLQEQIQLQAKGMFLIELKTGTKNHSKKIVIQ